MTFPIYLSPNKLHSNAQKAVTLQKSKRLGELKQGNVVYSSYEVVYLVETKKAQALKNEKPIKEQQLIKLFSKKDKEFYIKYLVFKELRKKGYILKTALKYGTEFRVYEKNLKHAKYLLYITKQSQKLDLKEFISMNRIAHSTAKNLLMAVVDPEESIIFYEATWKKP